MRDDIVKVCKNSNGYIYGQDCVSCIALIKDDFDDVEKPTIDFTDLRSGEFVIDATGKASLQDWKLLLNDLLTLIDERQKGTLKC